MDSSHPFTTPVLIPWLVTIKTHSLSSALSCLTSHDIMRRNRDSRECQAMRCKTRRLITENISPREHKVKFAMTQLSAYGQSRVPGLSGTPLEELRNRLLGGARPLYPLTPSSLPATSGAHLHWSSTGVQAPRNRERPTGWDTARHSVAAVCFQREISSLQETCPTSKRLVEVPTATLGKRNGNLKVLPSKATLNLGTSKTPCKSFSKMQATGNTPGTQKLWGQAGASVHACKCQVKCWEMLA